MSHVLHLLGPGLLPTHAAEAADAIAAGVVPRPAVAGEASGGDRVMAVGPDAAAAARLGGLCVDATLCPPGGPGTGGRIPLTARATLRLQLPRLASGPGDAGPACVVAWSPAALAAAAAFLPAVPRLLRLADDPGAERAAWLVSRMAAAGFDVAAASEPLAERLVAAGLPAGRVRVHPPTLDDERLRGPGSAPTTGVVFAVTGGPGVDARDPVLAAALAQEATGRRVTLRLSPRCDRLAEALDVADAADTSAGGGPRVVQDASVETPWSGLGGVTAALLPVGGPALAAGWAQLAGVPRVFTCNPARLGVHGDARPGDAVAAHPVPRDLAAAMAEVMAEPGKGEREKGREGESPQIEIDASRRVAQPPPPG